MKATLGLFVDRRGSLGPRHRKESLDPKWLHHASPGGVLCSRSRSIDAHPLPDRENTLESVDGTRVGKADLSKFRFTQPAVLKHGAIP